MGGEGKYLKVHDPSFTSSHNPNLSFESKFRIDLESLDQSPLCPYSENALAKLSEHYT